MVFNNPLFLTFIDFYICNNNIGDKMKKTIIITILSIIIGYLLSRVVFNEYDINALTVNSNTPKYYFILVGSYDDYDTMTNNTSKLGDYIYLNDNNVYNVFTCITKDINNIDKITKYYTNLGYKVSYKEYNLSDKELSNNIDIVDSLLNNTDEIKEICKQSLNKYKEAE